MNDVVYKIYDNIVGLRDMTAEERAEVDARETDWTNNFANRKLNEIKRIREQKLLETDWWVLRGNITTAQSDYRQALRDIPSTYSESDYDLLLAVNENGELTHTIWSKP